MKEQMEKMVTEEITFKSKWLVFLQRNSGEQSEDSETVPLPVWFENSLKSPHDYDQGKENNSIGKAYDDEDDNYVDEINYDTISTNIDILPILMGVNKLSDSTPKIDKVLIRIWNVDITSKICLILHYTHVWQCQANFDKLLIFFNNHEVS